MFSEIECGVCYRTYNAARRCPRELRCKHSFCESCLRAMSRPLGGQQSIDCPLCRHTTTLSGQGSFKAELRVDESALERLVAAGVLEGEDREKEEEEEEEGEVPESEGEVPETRSEEGDSSTGSRCGRLRRSWRKVWMKISGKKRDECMTNDELRSMAMMACYMF
ncbi:E3 ubiquitin-protein ligase-like [Cyprinodon tularosa]|uniref:E3 ubiquitin-protein ligase-like n=1 Tax=Cyprinodon tularosa TaxID=77115 RepID=UPI0018E26C13|nr:E3 ubiquitin-protein ligase-like [Cyprinodon tularosa]